MTVSQLKALNIKNGGCFFDRDKMKFGGETLKSFTLRPVLNGTILKLHKKSTEVDYYFNPTTGRVVHPTKEQLATIEWLER